MCGALFVVAIVCLLVCLFFSFLFLFICLFICLCFAFLFLFLCLFLCFHFDHHHLFLLAHLLIERDTHIHKKRKTQFLFILVNDDCRCRQNAIKHNSQEHTTAKAKQQQNTKTTKITSSNEKKTIIQF